MKKIVYNIRVATVAFLFFAGLLILGAEPATENWLSVFIVKTVIGVVCLLASQKLYRHWKI